MWWVPVVGSCAAVRSVTAAGTGAEHRTHLSVGGEAALHREGGSESPLPADRDLEQVTHPPCVFPSSGTCAREGAERRLRAGPLRPGK